MIATLELYPRPISQTPATEFRSSQALRRVQFSVPTSITPTCQESLKAVFTILTTFPTMRLNSRALSETHTTPIPVKYHALLHASTTRWTPLLTTRNSTCIPYDQIYSQYGQPKKSMTETTDIYPTEHSSGVTPSTPSLHSPRPSTDTMLTFTPSQSLQTKIGDSSHNTHNSDCYSLGTPQHHPHNNSQPH